MKNQFIFILVLMSSFTFSLKAKAFRLDPMVANFTDQGEGTSKIFRVENEGNEKIAVKIRAYTRQIDDKGKETTVESKDFKIYPDQISLSPSDTRAVRVLYLGPKNLEQEAAYRIIATQMPVDFKADKQKTGIKFLFQYVASVYVTNDKFYPKVQIESLTRVDKDTLKIKVINKGQKHILLKNVNVELKDKNGNVLKIDDKVIKSWSSENILSGNRRTMKFKSDKEYDLTASPPKIEIKDEL